MQATVRDYRADDRLADELEILGVHLRRRQSLVPPEVNLGAVSRFEELSGDAPSVMIDRELPAAERVAETLQVLGCDVELVDTAEDLQGRGDALICHRRLPGIPVNVPTVTIASSSAADDRRSLPCVYLAGTQVDVSTNFPSRAVVEALSFDASKPDRSAIRVRGGNAPESGVAALTVA